MLLCLAWFLLGTALVSGETWLYIVAAMLWLLWGLLKMDE